MKRNRRSIVWMVAPLLTFGSAAWAVDLFVPSPEYPTIQSAVDAAIDGDTIILRTGWFTGDGNLDVRIESKELTIRGEAPTGTVIQGPGNPFEGQREAFFIRGPSAFVTLQDIEIRGCTGERSGGAVSVVSASVVFERVAFIDNSAIGDFSGRGGALTLSASVASIRDCTFRRNAASSFGAGGAGDGEGGAVWVGGGQAVFERCVFEDNIAGGSDMFGEARGGAIRASGTMLTLRKCDIRSNTATAAGASGGGISGIDSTIHLIGTNLIRNRASNAGGGISATGVTTVIGGRIAANRASNVASEFATCGGFRLRGATHMANVIIDGNAAIGRSASIGAGGLGGSASVVNCTFVSNGADAGNGLAVFDDATADVHSSILRDGTGSLSVGAGATLSIAFSNVQGGYPGTGNIDADPLFNFDRRLQPGSPCIDAGDSTALLADEFDLDGDGDTGEPLPLDGFGAPRRIDDPATADTGVGFPVVDIGAAEFVPPPCLADLDADGRLTVFDYLTFFNLFDDGSIEADFDGDGELTILDFLAFQDAFDAGCP